MGWCPLHPKPRTAGLWGRNWTGTALAPGMAEVGSCFQSWKSLGWRDGSVVKSALHVSVKSGVPSPRKSQVALERPRQRNH